MKRIVLSGLSVLLVFAASPPAFAYEKVDGANTGACQSIPPARPTEGFTHEIEAIQRCDIGVRLRGLQISSSSLAGQLNSLAEVPSPSLQSQNPGRLKQPLTPGSITTPSPTSGSQTFSTSPLKQQNPPSEVPSPSLQMYERQRTMITQMETMLAQMKVMMEQMEKMASSKPQTSRTSQQTQQNPSAEVPSPSLLLYEQQQAMIAQMEAMMAQMKVMMEQMKVISSTPTRHGVRSTR